MSARLTARKADFSPFPYLSDLNIPQIETDDVMILIGTDNPIAYIPLQVRGGDVNQPYAIRTHLGWIVRGPAHIDTRRNLTNIKFENAEEVLLQKHLERLWNTDFDDKISSNKTSMYIKDKRALAIMESTVIS